MSEKKLDLTRLVIQKAEFGPEGAEIMKNERVDEKVVHAEENEGRGHYSEKLGWSWFKGTLKKSTTSM